MLVVDLASLLIFRFSPTTESYTSGYLSAFFSIVGTRIVLRLRNADQQKRRQTINTASVGNALAVTPEAASAHLELKKDFRSFQRGLGPNAGSRPVTPVATDSTVACDLGGWGSDMEQAGVIEEDLEVETEVAEKALEFDEDEDAPGIESHRSNAGIEGDCVGRSSSVVLNPSRAEAPSTSGPRKLSWTPDDDTNSPLSSA